MNKEPFFVETQSWATERSASELKVRRLFMIVAVVAVAIAALEAVALALLVPLKSVQPLTVLVDRQTGYVETVDPSRPRKVSADQALTQSFLAQYVVARESFDRATASINYRKVGLWSAGGARSTYLTSMPASNPASPFNQYAPGTIVSAQIKSVSSLSPSSALVRFTNFTTDQSGRSSVGAPYLATVRYRYVEGPMSLEDRLTNPLGFQVLSYTRTAEVPDVAVSTTVPTAPAQLGYAPQSNDLVVAPSPGVVVTDQPVVIQQGRR